MTILDHLAPLRAHGGARRTAGHVVDGSAETQLPPPAGPPSLDPRSAYAATAQTWPTG